MEGSKAPTGNVFSLWVFYSLPGRLRRILWSSRAFILYIGDFRHVINLPERSWEEYLRAMDDEIKPCRRHHALPDMELPGQFTVCGSRINQSSRTPVTVLYSAKYRLEHEDEIALHRAAKQAFDALGVQKLPSVKSLNAQYARLLGEKTAAYAEYRAAREEMRELMVHRKNLALILQGDAKEGKGKEAEREGR